MGKMAWSSFHRTWGGWGARPDKPNPLVITECLRRFQQSVTVSGCFTGPLLKFTLQVTEL